MWVAIATLMAGSAAAQVPFSKLALEANHDTWATHDDDTVHGAEPLLKVGIEPKACQSVAGWDPCPDDGLVCCVAAAPNYSYCAPDAASCGATEPSWKTFRKFRIYVRFDVPPAPPDAKLLTATLSLRQAEVTTLMGGAPKIEAHRLKKIGFEPEICAWNEGTLNDTNGTLVSALVQNTSVLPDGTWEFNVAKAVTDWTVGDTDLPGAPIQPNCGFTLNESGFGKADAPLARWATFSSKEGTAAPKLLLEYAHDLDGDGWFADQDCDETNGAINPGVFETCNGLDDDCNGLTDEESCDGTDNDCDGAIDEDAWCGEGQACFEGKCQPTCTDDCKGPTDDRCVLLEGKVWQIQGCGQADEDPCLDWVNGKTCPEGWSCAYGSCSSNCLDDEGCDAAGQSLCVETAPGVWAVGTCGEADTDPCLDVTDLVPCGKGQGCGAGVCTGEACTDACEAGEQNCMLAQKTFCWTWEGTCTSWSEPSPCSDGCHEGVCAGLPPFCECTEPPPPCEDECPEADKKLCMPDDTIQTCGNWDEDECLEPSDEPVEPCPEGCTDGVCDEPPPPPDLDIGEAGLEQGPEPVGEPAPESTELDEVEPMGPEGDPMPDFGKPEVVEEPGEDTGSQPDDGSPPEAGPNPDGGTSDAKDDGGCGCRAAGPRRPLPAPALTMLLLLLLGALLVRRRGRDRGLS